MLVRNDWAACVGALLFASHPVQVEPVAWATGMKDVLSGFLSLVAVWQYLAYASAMPSNTKGNLGRQAEIGMEKARPGLKRRSLHYSLATLAFVLAMLSKPSAVVVPLVAWVLDFWILRRSMRQSAVALSVWIVLALPVMVATRWVQSGASPDLVSPLWARPLVFGDAVAFYLYQLVWPLNLSPDYGRTPEFILQNGWIYFTWIIPFSLTVLVWLWKGRKPWLVASLGIFVIGILPVSGLVPFGFQKISTVADRYLYLSMLGPALGLAFFLSQQKRLLPVVAFCLVILGFLAVKSTFQTRYWQNTSTLFNHALKLNPHSWLAHNNLGVWLGTQGKVEEAIQHYREVIRIHPYHVNSRFNLGNALLSQGKVEEALQYYEEAIRIDPHDAQAHYNLGNALRSLGKLEEAIGHYRQALETNPAYALAHNNLGIALAQQGNLDEAIVHFLESLRIDPSDASVYANLANIYTSRGELEKAIEHYRRALQLNPEFVEVHEILGQILAQQGRRDEAVQHLEEALRIMKSRDTSELHMTGKGG